MSPEIIMSEPQSCPVDEQALSAPGFGKLIFSEFRLHFIDIGQNSSLQIIQIFIS